MAFNGGLQQCSSDHSKHALSRCTARCFLTVAGSGLPCFSGSILNGASRVY